MKSKLTLLAAVCGLLFSSCQKEAGQDQNSGDNGDRLKTYTETITSTSIGNSSTTYNITYDNSGRITGVISAASPGDKFIYSYPSADRFSMDLYNSAVLSVHEDFYLNAASFIDSSFQYNDTKDSSTEKYIYDINNRLTTLKEYDYSKRTGSVLYNTTTYTYDTRGNLIKTVDTDGDMHAYEYYPDLSYVMPFQPGPINANSSKKMNLVKTHSLSFGGSLVATAQFTYTFDTKNRISTEKAVIDDGSVVVKTYTYY